MTKAKKEWIIVGFDHPQVPRSLIYKQRIRRRETLHAALDEGIDAGCNLFSIRGIDISAPTVAAVSEGTRDRQSVFQYETTAAGTAAQKGQSKKEADDNGPIRT